MNRAERDELRRRIDLAVRERAPYRAKLERHILNVRIPTRIVETRDRRTAVVKCLQHCRTDGCDGESKTHAGPYKGLCDDCIIARGHHLALA